MLKINIPFLQHRMTGLQRFMTLLAVFAVLLSFLFGMVFAYLNRQDIYRTVGMEMEYDVQRVSNNMSVQLENIQSIFDEILNDDYLQRYASNVFDTSPFQLIDFNKRLKSMADRNHFIDTVDVFIEQHGVLFTSDNGPTAHLDPRTKEYLRESMEASSGLTITRNYRSNLYYWMTRHHSHVTFTFPIYKLYGGKSRTVGLVAVSVRESSFLDLMGTEDGRCRLLLNQDGSVFLTNNVQGDCFPSQGDMFDLKLLQESKRVFQVRTYGERQLLAHSSIPYTGWTLVVMDPLSHLTGTTGQLGRYTFLLVLLNALLLLAGEILIMRHISKRIQPLVQMMENIDQDSGQAKQPDAQDEFSYLFDSFYAMQQRIKQQFNEIYHLSLLQKKANLRLMHAQVNPHFIYNIFYNMNWLLQLKKYDKLEDMVEAVAIFFKKSLNNGRPLISIQNEMEMLKSYITIQHIRFGDRFQTRIDVQPELMDIQILGHMMQPLLENAIRHGIEPLTRQGTVAIRGYLKGENLIFEVEDNGVGIQPDVLQDIRLTLSKAQTDAGRYFALNNVHQRIQILYGEAYGLEVESEVGKGTLVRINLPKTPPKNGISAGMGLEGE